MTYTAFSKTVVKLHSGKIIKSLSSVIKNEYKRICSDQHASILRGSPEAIKAFSWSQMWDEMQQHLPTLVSLISALTPGSNKRLVCTIISMLLKKGTKEWDYCKRLFIIVLCKWRPSTSRFIIMRIVKNSYALFCIKYQLPDHNLLKFFVSKMFKSFVSTQKIPYSNGCFVDTQSLTSFDAVSVSQRHSLYD